MVGHLTREIPDSLGEHYRNCALPLARLRLIAMAEDGVPVSLEMFEQVNHAVAEALAEIGAARSMVIDGLAGRDRCQAVGTFLTARLTRLRVAADGIDEAARTGDLPALRRSLLTFHALAAAMWKVQLGVCDAATISALTRQPSVGVPSMTSRHESAAA